LEGDCVGLTWPIPQAGLFGPGFFFVRKSFFLDKSFFIAKSFIDKSFIAQAMLLRRLTLRSAATIIRT